MNYHKNSLKLRISAVLPIFNLSIFLKNISVDDKNQLLKEIANNDLDRFFEFQ